MWKSYIWNTKPSSIVNSEPIKRRCMWSDYKYYWSLSLLKVGLELCIINQWDRTWLKALTDIVPLIIKVRNLFSSESTLFMIILLVNIKCEKWPIIQKIGQLSFTASQAVPLLSYSTNIQINVSLSIIALVALFFIFKWENLSFCQINAVSCSVMCNFKEIRMKWNYFYA